MNSAWSLQICWGRFKPCFDFSIANPLSTVMQVLRRVQQLHNNVGKLPFPSLFILSGDPYQAWQTWCDFFAHYSSHNMYFFRYHQLQHDLSLIPCLISLCLTSLLLLWHQKSAAVTFSRISNCFDLNSKWGPATHSRLQTFTNWEWKILCKLLSHLKYLLTTQLSPPMTSTQIVVGKPCPLSHNLTTCAMKSTESEFSASLVSLETAS